MRRPVLGCRKNAHSSRRRFDNLGIVNTSFLKIHIHSRYVKAVLPVIVPAPLKRRRFAPVIFAGRYPEIFGSCSDWQSFFSALKIYAKEKCPTIFFDRVGNLKENDSFYAELDEFLNVNSSCKVMLIGRPWDKIFLSYTDIEAESMTMPKLADLYSLKDETAAEIILLTARLLELFSAYDLEKSFEENVQEMLRTDSAFFHLATDWMNECFCTPESCNTLLYGMTQGKNRINELSVFSGYPKNKYPPAKPVDIYSIYA